MAKKDSTTEAKEEKVEKIHHNLEGMEGVSGVDYYDATTGAPGGGLHRYHVSWPIPKTDAECKARYGMSLQQLAIFGVKEISHGPNYKDLSWGSDGQVDQASVQALADGFKPGMRAPSQSAEEKELKAIIKESDGALSYADLLAIAKEKAAK